MNMTLIRSVEVACMKTELLWDQRCCWGASCRDVGDSQLLPLQLRMVLPARNSLSCSIRSPNLRHIYEIGKETFTPQLSQEWIQCNLSRGQCFLNKPWILINTSTPLHPLRKHTALPSLLSNVFGSGSQNHQGILMLISEILIFIGLLYDRWHLH